jgi:hypothetical protein
MEAHKSRYSGIDEIIHHRTQLKYDMRVFQGFPSLFESRNTKRFESVSKHTSIKDRFQLKLQRSGFHCMLKNASDYLSQEQQMQELKQLLEMNIKSKREKLKAETPAHPLQIHSNEPAKSHMSSSYSDTDSNYMSLECLAREATSGQKSASSIRAKNENILSQPQIVPATKMNRTHYTKTPTEIIRRNVLRENTRNKSLTHRTNTPIQHSNLRKKTLLSNISFTVTKIDTSKACSPIPSKLRIKSSRCDAGTNTHEIEACIPPKNISDSICTETSLDSVDFTFKNKLLPRFV